MRNVFTAETPADAHVVAGLLEEAGIDCVVEGELLTGVRMGLPMDSSTQPGVFVRDEDATRALALIAERRPKPVESAAASDVAEDDDLDTERTGLLWFKRLLLALMVFSVAGLAVGALLDFVMWLAGTTPPSGAGLVIAVWGPALIVAWAIACLVVPRRRARR